MRNWTTKDVKFVLDWAQSSESQRICVRYSGVAPFDLLIWPPRLSVSRICREVALGRPG